MTALGKDDPFQLNRLADDLAERESGNIGLTLDDELAHELPLLVPLSHEHPLLSSSTPKEAFNVDAFLLSRSNTSLADLRAELRDYLAVLKEELVQLINDDYAAFISLRTELRGEGPRLERLQEPLELVHREIDASRINLIEIQNRIQVKLEERFALREEKTLLHLLLKISDLVGRLENMLQITLPNDTSTPSVDRHDIGFHGVNGKKTNGLSISTNGIDEDDTRSSLGRVKHLGRIAAEYNQLLYHSAKASKQECVFVDELHQRIDRIQSTLSRNLDTAFSAAVKSLTSSAPARSRTANELSECLKIYETLGSWSAAEDIIRQNIVSPFIKKTIHPGALSAPLSPIIPRTPLLDVHSSISQSQNPMLSPSTPFTPYPHSTIVHAFPSSSDHITLITSYTDEPLVQLLNNILRFIDRDLRTILELTELSNSAQSYKRYKGRIAAASGNPESPVSMEIEEERFELMGRVVWPAVGMALMDDLGAFLFAAGRPDEFQKSYTILHEFITALEYAASSAHSVAAIRSHRVFSAFKRRWQLPVYFQLRWKEIIGNLEESLLRPLVDTFSKKGDGFFAPQARAVFKAIETLWSPTVVIPELGDRFWKLTLQIISRYKTWLDTALPLRRSLSASTSEKGEHADSVDADEAQLKVFASTLADIRNIQHKMRSLLADQILPILPPESILPEEGLPVEHALEHVLAQLDSHVPLLGSQVVSILTVRCTEPLQHVRSIPTQYRALSARKLDMPTESSYFVPNVLRPLREFILDADGPGVVLQKEFGTTWAGEIFHAVVTKYTAYLAGMKKTEDSLRRYSKGKRSAFMLFGAGNSANGSAASEKEGRDEARVRAQMVLDVETLGKDARSLGGLVNVDGSTEYIELAALAANNDPPT